MDARGQIGKSLVMMGWKGIKTARQYVVPANPKTAGQQSQRGHLSAVLTTWKVSPYNAADKTAFNVAASLQAKPMSGFNFFCSGRIKALVAGLLPYSGADFVVTANSGGTLAGGWRTPANRPGAVIYGSSPTNMVGSSALVYDEPNGRMTFSITGMVAGSVIYLAHKLTGPEHVSVSGIYRVEITA
jgi:hypothetical protein